ncbi:hypothetical protein ABIC16_002869 [Sphingomonas sp. PvP055]|uniref:hypothetical protein n=1 Tax=Sphingomonas sp. PvP055 TaxID=3156391 RepID=UPI003391D1D3
MANRSDPKRVIPVAPIVGSMVGAVAAVAFALLPMALVEDVVLDSGIASVVAAAAPPLGFTARLLLVVLGGGGLGMIAWLATYLLLGPSDAPIAGDGFVLKPAREEPDDAPILRRADAHPDAPSRPPLRADRDLGARLLDVAPPSGPAVGDRAPAPVADVDRPAAFVAGRAMPDDLDQPLAAYAVVDPPAPTAVAPNRDDPAETIHALLDRLERVLQRTPAAPVALRDGTPIAPAASPANGSHPGAFEDTLATLRALAIRSV